MFIVQKALSLLTLFVAGLALSAGPAAAQKKDKDYTGEDAGYMIYAVGTIRIGMHFTFPYRRIETLDSERTDDWKGRIRPHVGGAFRLKIKRPHFEGFESGHVIVRKLPPGRYAVTDFEFAGSAPGGGGFQWNSGTPFALEFTIEPGKATYIGSFMRSPTPSEELVSELGYAGYFLVADRGERDLPIARNELPEKVSITSQVTDVEEFGSSALRNHSLEPEVTEP